MRHLDDYQAPGYVYEVVLAEAGGSVVRYPDLRGCFVQVKEDEDIRQGARDVLTEWLTLALEDGDDVSVP